MPNQIKTTQVRDAAITSVKIGTNAIVRSKIADNAVSTAEIVDSAITSAKIATDAIVRSKLANNAVSTAELVNSAVTSNKLGADSVVGSKISNSAVTSNKLGSNSVVTSKIAASAVSTTQIANGAITSNKLGANSVVTTKITNGAVTSAKIASGTITGNQIVGAGGSTLALKGNLQISGDLIVLGSKISAEVQNLHVSDAFIRAAANNSSTADLDAGLEVYRGSTRSVARLAWDEGLDTWTFGVDGVMTPMGSSDSNVDTAVQDLTVSSADVTAAKITTTIGILSSGATTDTSGGVLRGTYSTLMSVYLNGVRQLESDWRYKYSGGTRLIKFLNGTLDGSVAGEKVTAEVETY